MSRKFSLIALTALVLGSAPAYGDSDLLFFEAQGIIGYSSLQSRVMYYTMNRDAQMLNGNVSTGAGHSHNHGTASSSTSVSKANMYYAMNKDGEMQKPGLGVDYLHRFSGETGDWGSLGFQGRLALTVDQNGGESLEPQAYNAWLKVKTPFADVWAGHNRPAFGLGSYFDGHSHLLRTLSTQSFGYDRDWGVGANRDFSWGNLQVSATTGSGMPFYYNGNYMLASRVAFGVLNEDNYTLGLSAGYGRTLETEGYTIYGSQPRPLSAGGADFAFLHNNFEHRFDVMAGEWLGASTLAGIYRLGYRFGPEERLKIELQPTYWRSGREDWLFSACLSALVTSNLTFRTMYEYNRKAEDHRFIAQLYYYLPL